MLYKNPKAMVCSSDGNTDVFNIVPKRYISDLFIYNLPRLHTLNISRSNKRKWFYTKKRKK